LLFVGQKRLLLLILLINLIVKQPQLTMKKTILTFTALLACLAFFSFAFINNAATEIKITVTADKETQFDMFQNSKVVKDLKTPYEFTIKAEENKFVFKPKDLKTTLKIKAQKKLGGVTGEYLITVLLIDSEQMTVFGMD